MRQVFITIAIIIAFSVTYGYAMMHEGGHMKGETQQGQAASPGYGMMGQGGHMQGYGSGGYGMMGQGYGGHMMGGDMMGSGCGGHMMGGMLGYGTAEEQQKFLNDTTELRREMHNKKFEYSEAMRNPDTKRATLFKLKKELLEIKVKMYEKAIKNN